MPIDIRPNDDFLHRHLGSSERELDEMLEVAGFESYEDLVTATIPASIRLDRALAIPDAVPESRLLKRLMEFAQQNRVCRSYLGMGYHDTITPPVIQRNILENPGWYTQYTPYQAEISQGRLEALLNYQTMVMDLTGLAVANASLLDEATAAAEAMTMLRGMTKDAERSVFLVAESCHPQTIAVIRTRAEPQGIEVVVGDHAAFSFDQRVFGALLQYPTTDGSVLDYRDLCAEARSAGAAVVVAADLLSLTLLTPPGEFGADVAVGNTQRFGVPMGFGGPHAAYMAVREEFTRRLPGRIIGVSVDADGKRALRMALQTREQHIRRERATSNICTAQVLLAVMAGAYAVWHGPQGLRAIASRIHGLARILETGLGRLGHRVLHDVYFDTLRVEPVGLASSEILARAADQRMNLRDFGDGTLGIALDETTGSEDLDALLEVFSAPGTQATAAAALAGELDAAEFPDGLQRTSSFMEHEVFHRYRSETEMLRYLHKLESKDLSLTASMIPLGSCTMKLNATTEMAGITWPEFGGLHPFAPEDQTVGYRSLFTELESWLAEIAGLPAVSLQPNSGAQGEYTGLLVIRAYHRSRGDQDRRVCLIPSSAHGTNPASAVMAGMRVVVVRCDDNGNIDVEDLRRKAEEHGDRLGAIMVTYPSTHGVFEEEIRAICETVHQHGGQVYLDGANLNAQVGLCRPGDYGADVIHINLHKTFAIPHGGGGPGVGPICVAEHLAAFLPGHPVIGGSGDAAIGAVSAAPWGSSSILPISWAYIAMLGREGVRRATEVAILNANYMARKLEEHFEVLYRGKNGQVAHEFILDLRPFKKTAGITDEDVAKRLIDYGFHGPTMSFPVAGTMMVEPTESESKAELDRFCDAMISIRAEIQQIELGIADREDNVLKNAPHTAEAIASDEWHHAYRREQAAFPSPASRQYKFWPVVGRVNNAHGDRNLVCACPPIESYAGGATEG